jgi:integral membrane protein (TIGR01906 family)
MKFIKKAMYFLLIITLPLLIVITSIRIVLTPLFLEVEYRLPGFPADDFGFTFQERLNWAKISLNYLVNNSGIETLGNQKLANEQPLYEERELSHMKDVKDLTQSVLLVWYLLIALFALAVLFFWNNGARKEFWEAISLGGWVTIGLVVLVILGVFLNFDALFTGFHRIFFKGDTWLFLYSNTLIRLFPERLWQDVFLFIGGFSLIFSTLAGIFGRKLALAQGQKKSPPKKKKGIQ